METMLSQARLNARADTPREQRSVPGLIYRSSLGYELAMMALYGRHYFSRHREIADLIAPGSTVLDLCCGPGILYRRYLHKKLVRYTGFDSNARFIKQIIKAGGRGEVRVLSGTETLPPSDYVIMQASLYHFLPDAAPILQRMFTTARRAVIMSEPIRNLADSRHRTVRMLGARLSNVGKRNEALRFNEDSIDRLIETSGHSPSQTFFIRGGREKVYVFRQD